MYKRLVKNSVSLGFVTLINLGVPLIVIPLLVKSIGIKDFGIIAFSQAILSYLSMLCDYSFNITATRIIGSIKSKDEINRYTSEVVYTKVFLAIVGLLFVFVFLIASNNESILLISIICLSVIPYSIQNNWFYIGTERSTMLPLWNVFGKGFMLLTVVLIYSLGELTSYTYAIIYIISIMITSIFNIVKLNKICNGLEIPKFGSIKGQILNGLNIFISTLSASGYRNFPVIVMGGFNINPAYIGAYSLVERVVRVITNIIQPISQACVPVASKKYATDIKIGLIFSTKVLLLFLVLSLFSIILLHLFSSEIIYYFTNDNDILVHDIWNVLIYIPVVVAISNVLGVLTLINLGLEKQFNYSIAITGLTGVSLSILASMIKPELMTYVVIWCEFQVMLFMSYYLIRHLNKTKRNY